MKITEEAKAKINLYLDVFPPRESGYHDIKSVMHTVSLADIVSVDTDCAGIRLTCTDASLPTDDKNLAYRAAKLFFQKAEIDGGAYIYIEKNIPVAGGLAGGSTDAAAVLRALNTAFGEPLGMGELCAVGAELGADVPFCITGGCALCTGFGEIITPLPTLPETVCVIANGGEGVSTPAAYKKLDEMYGSALAKDNGNIYEMIAALDDADVNAVCKNAYNIFESAVLPLHATASRLREIMSAHGAILSMMSGSGPSVFALYENSRDAEAAADEIKAIGALSHVCKTV